ncbi:4601_t:CDS:2 [Funneliformis caledonium]|uniref:4601_t:CDS:1 n=1 Tax=Funneliformis caledonium TaxID=1117310 RepID=A0A9N9GTB6_9GLOM|nr:4601_t:CDS:2 [Funneliformis caledonium]
MLKDNEFKAIEELIEILRQFVPTNITKLNIDLDEFETVFDDIIPEGNEELLEEMTNNLNNSHIQRKKKININFS